MTTIVTRAGKGSPLTNNEVDANFTNLNNAKIETLTSTDSSVTITGTGSSRDLSVPVNPNVVSGPASATDNAVARFDGTTGKLIQNSTAATIDDSGNADFLSQKADYFDVDTTATTTASVGRVRWDAAKGTAVIGEVGGNLEAAIGQTLDAYVTNAEAVTITKGQAVYLYQATGNRASVKLAYNTSDATSAKTLGIAAEDIGASQTGLVRCRGVLEGLNLGSYTTGNTLYLGATAGSLTATKPAAPNHLVYIGVVERANNGNGQLFITVQNGYELDEIHDVQINSGTLANGQTILYDAATALWKNANLTAGTGVSVTNGASSVTIANTGVTSIAASTGISVSGSTGGVTITNSAPDQTVAITGAGGATVTGTYPNFTVTTPSGTVTSVTGTSPVASSGGATPAISLSSGYGDTQNPYASKTANYFLAAPNGTAGVPTFRAIVAADIPTLNQNTTGSAGSVVNAHTAGTGLSGSSFNGSAAVTWNLANTTVTAGSYTYGSFTVDAQGRLTAASSGTAPVTSVTGTSPVVSSGGTTPAISMPAATSLVSGYLSSTDWTTFNNKLSTAVTSATAGTGISVSASTGAVTFTNSGVTSVTAGSGISVSASTGGVTITNTASGATISDDTTTNATRYPLYAAATSGTASTVYVSSTKYTYNPSTGTLSATVLSSSSDERLKTNWSDLDTNFVSKLANVKSGTFDRIDFGTRDVGVSAQSLQALLPQAVISDEEGYLSVNYGGAALVAAIELAKEVKALRAEIAELKAKG